MFSPSLFFLFLGASFVGSRRTTIDCRTTADDLLNGTCVYGKPCTVHCNSSCLMSTDTHVYGTNYYTTASSVCKSALHDLRISSWNTSAQTVTFEASHEKRYDFEASTRYRITSENLFGEAEYFRFLSPKIKEEVLDVTALHRNFIYNERTMPQLECHGPEGRAIYFDYAIKEVPFKNLTLRSEQIKGIYRLKLPSHSYTHSRTNLFWCHVENTTLSYVGSPAMYYGELGPHFLPLNYTVTASLLERVTLQVRKVPGDDGSSQVSSWTRVDASGSALGKTTRSSSNSTTWTAFQAVSSHNGVYVANGMNTVAPGKNRAIFRVIVRSCFGGTYGQDCSLVCPKCENGGVCHDITGQCICPPGFMGETCSVTCGDDFFGRYCQRHCSDTNRDRNEKTCEGILMCLPDPYGCSCGTGYYGPFCNQTCPPHQYGADCKQRRVCFCESKDYCNIHTGTCQEDHGRCRHGWKNSPYCDQSYPLLKDAPIVSEVTDKEATVRFHQWIHGIDMGEGNPVHYCIQYKATYDTWTAALNVTLKTDSTVLKLLRSGTYYHLRVLVIDRDGMYREQGAKYTRFRTACGEPLQPPQMVDINNNSVSEIIVSWRNPDHESWQCWSVNVVLEVNNTLVEFNLTKSPPWHTNWYSIQTAPYMPVTIRLRLRTPNNKYSPWTKTWNVTSAEDAPGEVVNVKLLQCGPRNVTVSWSPPEQKHGVIRAYRVVYRLLASRIRSCNALNQLDTTILASPTHHRLDLMPLRPYTNYFLSVAALTVKYGPEMNATFNTEQDIPEGVPTQLHYANISRSLDTLTWAEVPCGLRNGPITSYYVEIDSVDHWENKLRQTTVNSTSITYRDLLPYTRYRAKVYAENAAGRSQMFASTNFTTPIAPPRAPGGLDYDLISQDSILLMWEAPYPPAGVLEHYQLQYWKAKTSYQPIRILINDTMYSARDHEMQPCFTVRGLEENMVYNFMVRAKNVDTEYSPYSITVEAETKEKPPGAPASIWLSKQTECSLKVQWDPPARKNGALTSYKLNCSLSHTFNAMLDKSLLPMSVSLNSSDSREFYLRGLFPGSTYLICVEAATSAGFGNAICDNFSTKASVPEVKIGPQVGEVVHNEVSITLYPVNFEKGPITSYYVLVLREGEVITRPVRLVNYTTSQDMGLGYYVAACLTPGQLEQPMYFVVGSDSFIGGFENPPLSDATTYRFGLLVESNFSGDVLQGYSLTAAVTVNGGSNSAGVGVVVGASLVIICLTVAVIATMFYCIRKRRQTIYRSESSTRQSMKVLSRLSKSGGNVTSESSPMITKDSNDYLMMAVVTHHGLPSKPVSVLRLQEYISHGERTGFLKEEYMTIAKGQLHPWDVALKVENKPKNRYEDILPYDRSRVRLTPMAGFDKADYINASYLPGYKFPRKYIATQGPMAATVTDFWRMVWQEGSCKVVMLTNLEEQGKTKCEQYWPDTTKTYGKFSVKLLKTETQVDFVIRQLEISLKSKTRIVTQFHFTAWPEEGVPAYPDALLPFLKRIWRFQPCDKNPIVVHCSRGIGRTGTLILVDSMTSQAEAEGEVDLITHLHKLQQSRVNLLESQELDLALSPPALEQCNTARDRENAAENSPPTILPFDYRRPPLSVTDNGLKTKCSNAIYVNGFERRNAYLVTQLPRPETVDDFWEMLARSGSVTLITLGPLQDKVTPQFWPNLNAFMKYGEVRVEQTDTEDVQGLIVRTFTITHNSEPGRTVKQFHKEAWNSDATTPSSCDALLEMMQRAENWQLTAPGRTVVVQCIDGCQKSGLYCASAAICDQIKVEHELDVFHIVRNVRRSHPQFIINLEQYAFCYDLALSFVNTFDSYCNFQ
ncbi:receptor-type tyrosine-protein phosphatase T-like isoform X2 [Rhipicephalus microplus]|uniref:receptor-type tyrosine-protein phosphatase T-like isoform X2 n=1 Tax=Rhipicephalus microplus TaxID=6941 RepID=UPI003F6CA5F3